MALGESNTLMASRVSVTSDGEIDDECLMVRFLLCANEWDIRHHCFEFTMPLT